MEVGRTTDLGFLRSRSVTFGAGGRRDSRCMRLGAPLQPKPHSCIRSVLLPRGGIPPAARRRSRLALTLAEREDISRGIASRFAAS